MNTQTCSICPHSCKIEEGNIGFCGGRGNIEGKIKAINYGFLTSVALDPIEKKPLYHFYPGSKILSVGSFGCNFRCSFCQNHEISMAKSQEVNVKYVSPEDLIELANNLVPEGNIGIAYTYNEPLIGYEYVLECAKLARNEDLKNVLVTNGFINEEPLLELLQYIDAFNIDLKAFQDTFYKNISGSLDTVKHTIEVAAKNNHVEVTTLIIPGDNDSEDEIRELSSWLASIRSDIPLHLSRFFPRYQMMDRKATDINKVYDLGRMAREHLKYVYEGNC